jgi:hypothetical protein
LQHHAAARMRATKSASSPDICTMVCTSFMPVTCEHHWKLTTALALQQAHTRAKMASSSGNEQGAAARQRESRAANTGDTSESPPSATVRRMLLDTRLLASTVTRNSMRGLAQKQPCAQEAKILYVDHAFEMLYTLPMQPSTPSRPVTHTSAQLVAQSQPQRLGRLSSSPGGGACPRGRVCAARPRRAHRRQRHRVYAQGAAPARRHGWQFGSSAARQLGCANTQQHAAPSSDMQQHAANHGARALTKEGRQQEGGGRDRHCADEALRARKDTQTRQHTRGESKWLAQRAHCLQSATLQTVCWVWQCHWHSQ